VVSIGKAMNVEAAGQYYDQHYSATGEYYAPDESPIIGQAIGSGAIALGLQGDVTTEQFDALLRGINPNTGAVLRPHVNRADANKRAGFDITFSPPKSISIQALVAGDVRLIKAHHEAVARAMEQAQQCAQAFQWVNGVHEPVQTNNVIAVRFEHHDARESINGKHGPMPQLHDHVFVVNATQRPDGQWRGLQEKQIYHSRAYLDGIYIGELARKVQQLGYHIERRPDGFFELRDFTREQIDAFSERYQDIEREKAAQGITNAKAARSSSRRARPSATLTSTS
jgi:conjugative relaxase-like TrwC/TraI family protein